MNGSDFLIVGGGVAGLSMGAALAGRWRVTVLEAEDALGYHSSGRSVSFSHYGIGDATVRGLTLASRPFYETPPEGFATAPLAARATALYFAHAGDVARLDALGAGMARFTDAIRAVDPVEIARLCPIVRTGEGGAVAALFDPTGLKLDADALLQSCVRALRGAGGAVLTEQRVVAIERRGELWAAHTEAGETFAAPILVNAAGAWADRIAALAGVAPLGLTPKRRTVIVVAPPADADIARWPFVHSAASDFYMLPEAGRLLVSPADEVDDEPCDAGPDDYDIALAADRLEHYTTLSVRRIAHRWAGLRTFTVDRVPTAGFAPDAPGFFWLAGQGGYGLQTAPAMAGAAAALATGGDWPETLAEVGVAPADIRPERLFGA
ncbi:MAG: FAD-binding oxidoreductase [Sphingomonas sp.]|nr:FAD-binding oxidoreductase [Sphingomonas sp.]